MYETASHKFTSDTLLNFFQRNKRFKYGMASIQKENLIPESSNYNNNERSIRNKNKREIQAYYRSKNRTKLIPTTSRISVNGNRNYMTIQSRLKVYKTSSNFFKSNKFRIKNSVNNIPTRERDHAHVDNGSYNIRELIYFSKNKNNELNLKKEENTIKKNNYLIGENYNNRIYNISKNKNLKNSKRSIYKFKDNERSKKKYYNNQLPILNKINQNYKKALLNGISNRMMVGSQKELINKNQSNKENEENNMIADDTNNQISNNDYNMVSIFKNLKDNKTEFYRNRNKNNDNTNDKFSINNQMNSTNSDFGNKNIIFSQSNLKNGIFNKTNTNSFYNNKNLKTIGSINNITGNMNNNEKNDENTDFLESFAKTKNNFFMDHENKKSEKVLHGVRYSSNARKGFQKILNNLISNDKTLFQSKNKFTINVNITSNMFNKKNKLEKYNVGNILGKGAYATVKLITDKITNENFAMKIYEKSKLNDNLKKRCVYKEIEILKRVNHKNIPKLVEVIHTDTQILIIQEFVRGISLRDYYNKQIRNQKGISEHKAKIFKKIFKQIFEAMNYLHSNDMAHRDIKLENILMTKEYEIKIIDFGFGMLNPENKVQYFFCGTPNYMPPEIVEKRGYMGQKADLWSLGVLVYKLYCADFPFKGKNEKDLYKAIKKCDYNIINYVPDNVKKIIKSLIVYEPSKRLACKDVLKSEWLRN